VLLCEADIIDKCPSSEALQNRGSLGLLHPENISLVIDPRSLFSNVYVSFYKCEVKVKNFIKTVQRNIRREKEKFRCTSCAQGNNSHVERRKHKINKTYSFFYLINIRNFTY
jgi:hypothetical protein